MLLGLGLGVDRNRTVAAAGGSAPVNTVAPVISGNIQVGQTLTTTDGTWTGDAVIVFTYQWKRAGVNIGSATNNTYILTVDDASRSITCVVTGTNGVGNSSGTSNALVIDVYLVKVDNTGSTSDLTTYTFSTRVLGTAASNRRIVVGVATRNTGVTVSSMTIGGVAAAIVSDGVTSAAIISGTQNRTEMWSAAVPTGATGDIVVTFSAGTFRALIGVWALYGAAAATASTVVLPTANSDPSTSSVTVPAKGALVGYTAGNPSGSATVTWSAGATERFDEVFEITHSGADLNSTAGGATTVTADWDGTANGVGNGNGSIFAAWGP